MENVPITCGMCSFKSMSRQNIMKHTVRNHRFDTNFSVCCQYAGCGVTYQSWNSFKSHTYSKHNDSVVENQEFLANDAAGICFDIEMDDAVNQDNNQGRLVT